MVMQDIQNHYKNASYWGKICFMSTPDGENCGLVKNLAATAIVSSKVVQPLVDSFVPCGMSKLDEIPRKEVTKMDKIFLNSHTIISMHKHVHVTWSNVGSVSAIQERIPEQEVGMPGGLLGIDPRADIRHAKQRMVKAIQRDFNSEHVLKELERYWMRQLLLMA
ncbi:hypothetical protein EJB05_28472, partial [Eragrostis curvula]